LRYYTIEENDARVAYEGYSHRELALLPSRESACVLFTLFGEAYRPNHLLDLGIHVGTLDALETRKQDQVFLHSKRRIQDVMLRTYSEFAADLSHVFIQIKSFDRCSPGICDRDKL